MYRPKELDMSRRCVDCTEDACDDCYDEGYEYGADAMLEALKALPLTQEINWEYMNSDTYGTIGLRILKQYQDDRVNGTLVFIPEG